jgi:hypothetical protein
MSNGALAMSNTKGNNSAMYIFISLKWRARDLKKKKHFTGAVTQCALYANMADNQPFMPFFLAKTHKLYTRSS